MARASLLVLCGVLLGGCSDPPGEILVEARWRFECPDDENVICIRDEDLTIYQYNGQEGLSGEIVENTCSVVPIAGNALDIVLESKDGPRGLRIDMRADASSSAVLDVDCTVEFTDQNVVYRGVCGSAEPSEEQPCQLTALAIDPKADDGPQVSVRVACELVKSVTNPSDVQRVVVGQNDSPTASIRFANCDGV